MQSAPSAAQGAGRGPGPAPGERRLAVGYYVANFRRVLATVMERYDDLLTPGEKALVADFDALSTAAQRLYVRLISRRGPCFRRDALSYPEVGDLNDAVAELRLAEFVDAAGDLEPAELLPLLRRLELAELLHDVAAVPASRGAGRDELKALLTAWVPEPELDRAVRQRFAIVRPTRRDEVLAFRLLFFGNLSQDLTAFVLDDLGVVRYEAYELRRELRLFPHRRAVDDTLALLLARREISRLTSRGQEEEALALARQVLERAVSPTGWDAAARRSLDRILNWAGGRLERRQEVSEALQFYGAGETPPARERRARLLARGGRETEALELCRVMEKDSLDETEAAFAPRFARRLEARLGHAPGPLPRRRRRRVDLTLTRTEQAIEDQVLELVDQEEGRRGFFGENWLWCSLFGLAFWDIVFAPVPGAFEHPFQLGPLDLYSPDFRRRRRGPIAQRLDELASRGSAAKRLLATYAAKRGTANSLVTWDEDRREPLELALERLEGRHLAWVFERMSRDLRRYRRGFPDLFLVSRRSPGFELWEVKGPGDQLRPEQGAWLDYLERGGLPSALVRVAWR